MIIWDEGTRLRSLVELGRSALGVHLISIKLPPYGLPVYLFISFKFIYVFIYIYVYIYIYHYSYTHMYIYIVYCESDENLS
jgi:hypothetical protein